MTAHFELQPEVKELQHRAGVVFPQAELPGPTPLHALDRALAQWTRNRG